MSASGSVPFVLHDSLKAWPASQWTPATIASHLTSAPISARFGPLLHERGAILWETDTPRREVTVGQFIQWAQQGQEQAKSGEQLTDQKQDKPVQQVNERKQGKSVETLTVQEEAKSVEQLNERKEGKSVEQLNGQEGKSVEQLDKQEEGKSVEQLNKQEGKSVEHLNEQERKSVEQLNKQEEGKSEEQLTDQEQEKPVEQLNKQKECKPVNQLTCLDRSVFWGYIDYKYLAHVGKQQAMKDVDWSVFGVDKDGRDSTVWIGTDGAYTPCHYDSYGFNLHAQIHGSKRWVLFPPEDSAPLRPTRLPYEETSLFSRVDVLGASQRLSGCHARVVTLQAGDVLYVPPRWWHFVQCKGPDIAISVNTWVPVAEDVSSQRVEAITKALVSLFIDRHLISSTDDVIDSASDVINDVDDSTPVEDDKNAAMQSVATLSRSLFRDQISDAREPSRKKTKTSDYSAHERFLMRCASNGTPVASVTYAQLRDILLKREERYSPDSDAEIAHSDAGEDLISERDLLAAVLHPDVVAKIIDVLAQ